MADNSVDELALKVHVEVDQKDLIDLKKELELLKKESIKFKPEGMSSESVNNGSNGSVGSGNLEDKDTVQSMADAAKSSKEYLKKISEIEQKREEKEIRKEVESPGEGKGEDGESTIEMMIASMSSILGIGALAAAVSSKVQKMYNEKLDREVNLASLAYETNQTVESMKLLSYQAGIVGLSMNEIVESSKTFANEVFSGSNQQQMQLANALGINLVQEMRNAKTPQAVAMLQSSLYDRVFKQLLPSMGFAGASAKATSLSGLTADEAFRLQHINDRTAVAGGAELAALRGRIGTKEDVMRSYEESNLSQGRVKATLDKALSAGNIAKTISIDRANMEAKFVNLVANGLGGLGDIKNLFSGSPSQTNNNMSMEVHNRNHYNTNRSSAITKVGGQ